jgi:hypothetical protein
MPKAFKSIKDLEKHLKKKINKVLIEDVAPTVRKEQQKQIDKTVYDAYPKPNFPLVYERRETSGGLIADENIVGKLTGDGELEISNITKPNSNYDHSMPSSAPLAEVVEYGHRGTSNNYRYDYPTDRRFTQPRPFIQNTRDELSKSGAHKKSLKKGLRNLGLDVK